MKKPGNPAEPATIGRDFFESGPITRGQFEELLSVLERIADALEQDQPGSSIHYHYTTPPQTNMFQCWNCKAWYALGTYHSCGGSNFG